MPSLAALLAPSLAPSLALLAPGRAWAQDGGAATPRLALVIGNGAYAGAPLVNAGRDAQSIATALRELGFAVQALLDADRERMEAAISQAQRELQGRKGVGLLYYAGHGLQLDWQNFMVPVGARIERAADVPAQAVAVQRVLDAFKAAGNRMNIVVLDACRDNPFESVGTGRGLAQMDAPSGSFLAYATAPGNVAEDGATGAGNGPYALHLAEELRRRDARIEEVFKRVRFAVRRQTAGRQIPWESTSLEEDFSFGRGIVAPTRQAARERETAFDEELAAWNRIKESTNVDDFFRFVERYPSGLFSELAQLRIERLQRRAVQARPGAQGVAAPDTTLRRYEVGDVFWWDYEDQLKGTVQRFRFEVTRADDEQAEFNNGARIETQTGGLVKNFLGVKDPPIIELVADMAVGRRWRSAFASTLKGVTARSYYDSRVVAIEDIELPIGRTRAFRIEHEGETVQPDGARSVNRRTSWVDTARGLVVRNDNRFSTPADALRRTEHVWHQSSTRLAKLERKPR